MSSTIILTGYNGFLGSHAWTAFERAGLRVVLAGRSPPAHGQIEYVFVDFADPYSIQHLCSVPDVGAVVHLAANISWRDKINTELFATNTLSTGLLADFCAKRGAKLVYSSTAIVHGVRTPWISPSAPITPDTAYGRSKFDGETLITSSGCEHAILRFGGIFGMQGPSHLGINRAIDGALAGQVPELHGTGAALRNYLYVKDAAEMLLEAATQPEISGVHLAAGCETLSIAEMLEEISQTFLSVSFTNQGRDQASDQVIAVSEKLPRGRNFKNALSDLRQSTGK